MIKIAWDQGFRNIYRKKVRNDALLKQRFWKAMELYCDPYELDTSQGLKN